MSADSVGRVSTDTIGRHYRSSIDRHCRSNVSRVSAEISTDIAADTPPTYSTDILHPHTRPTSLPTLGRYSTEFSAEFSADTWARYRPTLGRASVEMLFKFADRQLPLPVDTWSVCRSTLGRHLDRYVTMSCLRHNDRLSLVYGSTFGGVLCIVKSFCFAEIF